jgi:putative ABC transport system permease protein
MLTVFFLPLVTAGIHLAFAFSVISKILVIFAFNDTRLNMKVTFFCFAIAGLIYAVVYKITSGFYYAIVIRKTENLTSFYNNK